jgi:molybdate transport system substrate-binding protein
MVVFAAASLNEAFNEVGKQFASLYPEASVTFNFAASSVLALQINEGAPADVFASADLAQMGVAAGRGNVRQPVLFATNRPIVVVPAGNKKVASFEQLAAPGVRLVLAGPEVPIGRYSREILVRASSSDGPSLDFGDRVLANLRSNETSVRAVLAKVELGEADAGIVYETDVPAAGGRVARVEIPSQFNVVAEYWIATTTAARAPAGASVFVEFVLSPAGQAVLAKFGFGRPGARAGVGP